MDCGALYVTDLLLGLMALVGLLAGAFFAGGRKQRSKDKLERANQRKATEKRITDALDGVVVDDDDWVKRLRERHK